MCAKLPLDLFLTSSPKPLSNCHESWQGALIWMKTNCTYHCVPLGWVLTELWPFENLMEQNCVFVANTHCRIFVQLSRKYRYASYCAYCHRALVIFYCYQVNGPLTFLENTFNILAKQWYFMFKVVPVRIRLIQTHLYHQAIWYIYIHFHWHLLLHCIPVQWSKLIIS